MAATVYCPERYISWATWSLWAVMTEGRPRAARGHHRGVVRRAASASRGIQRPVRALGGPKHAVSGLDPAQRLLGVRADQVQVLGFLDRTLGGGEHQAQLLGNTRLASVGDDHRP